MKIAHRVMSLLPDLLSHLLVRFLSFVITRPCSAATRDCRLTTVTGLWFDTPPHDLGRRVSICFFSFFCSCWIMICCHRRSPPGYTGLRFDTPPPRSLGVYFLFLFSLLSFFLLFGWANNHVR
ncbi:hypothetical protein HanIR_Chr06g0260921 [Helianthus annuus]|nr:hypothetical protein HanIR_Chr06g0260921 [Helianthus annuus]